MKTKKLSLVRGVMLALAVTAPASQGMSPEPPSMAVAKSALESRIEQQSEGRIKLISFEGRIASQELMEFSGERGGRIDFEAVVEFSEPCQWQYLSGDRPVTFKTFSGNTALGLADRVFGTPFIEVAHKGDRFKLRGYELLVRQEKGWKLAGLGAPTQSAPFPVVGDALSDDCVKHLKQIGLAFRIWSGDHNDFYPFNLSTNAGGTKELSARGDDGFERNAAVHFQVMADELGTTRILVCPSDSSRKVVAGFKTLRPENVSYRVRSGPQVDDLHPEEILATCPIHGHILFADGSVKPKDSKDAE